MKKGLILLMSLLTLSVSNAQRVNKKGQKMVSKVFCYSNVTKSLCDKPVSIHSFHYDEEGNLVAMEVYEGTTLRQKYKKDGNTLTANYYDLNGTEPGVLYEYKFNFHGHISEALECMYAIDGSGNAMVNEFEYEYGKYENEYRLSTRSKCTKYAPHDKKRKDWVYTNGYEEHSIDEYEYPCPDYETEIYSGYSFCESSIEREKTEVIYTDRVNDTNINVAPFLWRMVNNNDCVEDLNVTEWCALRTKKIPMAVGFDDCEQQFGFDEDGNWISYLVADKNGELKPLIAIDYEY